MRIEVGNGIVVCDRSMLEVDTSCMQWRKDFENMPKDGSNVLIYSQHLGEWGLVYWDDYADRWSIIDGDGNFFAKDSITAYCIPTVPTWEKRNW